MDTVTKIYREIERLRLKVMGLKSDFAGGQKAVLTELLGFIESQNELPTSVWHKATDEPSTKDECLVISKHGKSVCIYANGLFYTGSVVSECCIYCKLSDVLSWARTEDLLKL